MQNRKKRRGKWPRISGNNGGPPDRADLWKAGGILIGIADQKMRSSVRSALEELDRKVVSVADGFQLVEQLADEILDEGVGNRPSLLVVEALLPGCTGLSLLTGLRDLKWRIPAVLLVPKNDELVRGRAWECGACGVFMTPYEPRELTGYCQLMLEPDAVEAHADRTSSEALELERRGLQPTIGAFHGTSQIGATSHG